MDEKTLRILLAVGSIAMIAALVVDFAWVITTALAVR